MRKNALLLVIFLLMGTVEASWGDEEVFVFDGEQVNIDDDKLPKELEEKIIEADRAAQTYPFILNKAMRAEVIKALGINEEDFVFLKLIGEEKATMYKISSLEMRAEVSYIAEDNVAGLGFKIDLKGERGFAVLGSKNPFNDTKGMSRVHEIHKTYKINQQFELAVSRSLIQAKGRSTLDGYTDFTVTKENKQPVNVGHLFAGKGELAGEIVNVYAGDVFNDNRTLIYISKFQGCGAFIWIKKDEVKMQMPPCGVISGC